MKYIVLVIFIFGIFIEAQNQTIVPCQTNETCKNILKATAISMCNNGICMCTNDTTKSIYMCTYEDTTINSKQRVMRRNCLKDEDCNEIEGARCLEDFNDNSKRTCVCPSQTIIAANRQKCLTVATEPLAPCIESKQCIAGLDNADCEDGKCRCRMNFHFAPSKKLCIPNKMYGDKCNKKENNCFQLASADGRNSLICSDQNTCKCQKNYVYIDNICQYSDASRIVFETFVIITMVIFTIKLF